MKKITSRTRRPRCLHRNPRSVGQTAEGMGTMLVYWCPTCGALKRTMVNWRYLSYPWELPNRMK
jgi:hypothetical protein